MAAPASEADPRDARPRWLAVSIALCLALGALSIEPGLPARGQESGDDGTAGLSVGVPVPYESVDGSESLTFTVEAVIDPYQSGLTASDQDRLASETNRYVGVRLMVGNDASEPLPYFFTSQIVIDAGAALHRPRSVQRDRETSAAEPRLRAGEIPAGASIEGLLFYELPEAAEVEMILYTRSPDPPVTLSSRGVQPYLAASATEEPTTTDEPTTTEEPTATQGEAPTAVAAILTTGIPVPYESLDGSESMLLTVDEVIDPYEAVNAYEQVRLSDEGKRWVAVRLSLENTNDTPIPLFFPYSIKLLDADTVLHTTPGWAPRDPEAQAADPDLPTGEIGAGATISGLLFYELSATAELDEVVFLPSDDRLISLASRTASGPSTTATQDTAPPAVAAPPEEPQPRIAELEANGAYWSGPFGHRVRWNRSDWSVAEALVEEQRDRLVLEDEVASIAIEGRTDFEGDAERCLVESVNDDLDESQGFDAVSDEVVAPTEDGDVPPHAGLYLLIHADADGRAHELVRYVECRTLEAGAVVLRVVATAPVRFWPSDRDRITAVLGSITLPAWAPDPVTDAAQAARSIPYAGPPVPVLECASLLTREESEIALAVWERVRAGEDGDTLGHSMGEVCSEQIASDERVRVRLEPGDPDDFMPGATLLGAPGRPMPALGDAALVFRDGDAGGQEGLSILSVRERRDVGELFFRLTLGRPTLDSPTRTRMMALLARDILPRFPGESAAVTATGPPAGTIRPEPDLSDLSYVHNLLAKEESGEWTRGEGLVAMLQLFAGEADAADVLRHQHNLGWEGTGIMEMAFDYLEDGPDERSKKEIARLLDLLTWTEEELEAMAAHNWSPVAGRFRLASTRTAQGVETSCEKFYRSYGKKVPAGVGPCIEWKSVNVPAAPAGKYRVFVPAPSYPQGGWEKSDFDLAVRAVARSAQWYETTGSSTARAVGASGKMPSVNVVFTLERTDHRANADSKLGQPCIISLYDLWGKEKDEHKEQILAHELAHCFQTENFPNQKKPGVAVTGWWTEGTANHLSAVIYPHSDIEWRFEDEAHEVARGASLVEMSYATYLFWLFASKELGEVGILDLVKRLPTSGGSDDQAKVLAGFRSMDKRFQAYLEALADGSIVDPSGTTSRKLEHETWTISDEFSTFWGLDRFAAVAVGLEVEECKKADIETDPDDGSEAARHLGMPGTWAEVPATLPDGSVGSVYVATATDFALVTLSATEVYRDEADPECEEEPEPSPTPEDSASATRSFPDWCPKLECDESGFFRFV